MRPDESSLGALMAQAQAGDGAAYRAVLETSQAWLKRFFANRIAPGAVDDLVQETLMSIHAKRASYDPARPFLPWLAAIARYRWIDQLRRSYRKAENEAEEADGAIASAEEEITARVSLQRLLDNLPLAQQQVIRLVKIDGLSVAEASSKSGQSQSLVKVNIHRGLKRLAHLVEEE